jgi:hypothetical protein
MGMKRGLIRLKTLQVFENRILKGISANKMEEDKRAWEICIMRTFTIRIPNQSRVIMRTGVSELCNKRKTQTVLDTWK